MDHNYCYNCMSEIPSDSAFCPVCGHRAGEFEPNPRALKPMTVLNGKYLIGKVLGEGGFGITYMGLDLVLNHKVAIKEFFPPQLATRNVYESNNQNITVISGESAEIFQMCLRRYEAEARCLAKLETLPGIVKVLNFFYENNTAYMVMEYIPGETLKEYRKRINSRIPWAKAIEFLRPIIKSLSVLHSNNIIHRDISPDNIMITNNGELILIDFGTAVEFDGTEKSKAIELKRGYAPLEQYSSHGNQGPWTDVYQVCATLYHLISGEVLPDALSISRNNAKIKPLSTFDHSIPSSVESAILTGLNTEIKARIQSMDELYAYLYGGRKAIPKRKVIIGIAIPLSVILLGVFIFVIIKLKPRNNPSVYTPDERVQPEEIASDQNVESEITPEAVDKDTAEEYVRKKGLSYTSADLLTYKDNGDGITVTDADSSLTDIVIPETIDQRAVTAISGIGKNVTTIVLPDTVVTIDKAAFRNCVYLETIYIPASVESIATDAFENCKSLTNIIISSENKVFQVKDGVISDKNGNNYNNKP